MGQRNIQSDIKKLYAQLEKLDRSECRNMHNSKEVDFRIVTCFENFFQSLRNKTEDDDARTLTDSKFLLEDKFGIEIEEGQWEDQSIDGDSLLIRAMSIKRDDEPRSETLKKIIEFIIKYCPKLIFFQKLKLENGERKETGVTPIHIAIFQEDEHLLKKMAEKLDSEADTKKQKKSLTVSCVDDDRLNDTVMTAGTLLGIATLMFNKTIFKIILRYFESEIDVTDNKKDNIIHSLIKYASIKPDKMDNIVNMVNFIVNCEFITKGDKEEDNAVDEFSNFFAEHEWKLRIQVKKLLLIKNKEHLTPLQLAAKRKQFSIFEKLIQHEIYSSHKSNDGLYHKNSYDITDVETISLPNDEKRSHDEDIKREHHESVLEYVVRHDTINAFRFTNITPVKEVIKAKWKCYRPFFWGWLVLHLLFMILLSVAAALRSEIKESVPGTRSVTYVYLVGEINFVTIVSIIGLIVALLYISIEIVRIKIARFTSKSSTEITKRIKSFFSQYSNNMFRFYFVLFSLLLIIDFVFAIISAKEKFTIYENYCLIFSVLIGWYLVLFFVQVFEIFSFYTVLIQRVITDMFMFGLLMGLFLLPFSIAMYMVMQGAETDSEDFNNIPKTMMKMFTIMLGIGELNVLFNAREPVLAIIVFVLFVLLTTVLLLNALIAVMSNSCTDLMANHAGFVATKMHHRLQKLSIIIFLEGFLPDCWCKEVGEVKKIRLSYDKQVIYKCDRRIYTNESVHEKTDKDVDAPVEPVQLTDYKITIPSQEFLDSINQHITESFENRVVKAKKRKASNRKSQNTLQKRIEISDIEQSRCKQCDNQKSNLFQSRIEVIETTS